MNTCIELCGSPSIRQQGATLQLIRRLVCLHLTAQVFDDSDQCPHLLLKVVDLLEHPGRHHVLRARLDGSLDVRSCQLRELALERLEFLRVGCRVHLYRPHLVVHPWVRKFA